MLIKQSLALLYRKPQVIPTNMKLFPVIALALYYRSSCAQVGGGGIISIVHGTCSNLYQRCTVSSLCEY